MKLMTKELERKLPPMGATNGMSPDEIKIPAKFFDSATTLAFFPIEYDPQARICYGLVAGHECVLGRFSVDELESLETVKNHLGFSESTLSQVHNDLLSQKELASHVWGMVWVPRKGRKLTFSTKGQSGQGRKMPF